MTPAQFATHVRFRTRTTSTTFTDDEIIGLLRVHIDTMANRVLELDEDYFGTPQTADLVATAGNFENREYPFPSDILNRVSRVEAKLDGTDWVKLQSFDLSEYARPTDDATILKHFTNTQGNAYYDIFRLSMWIYCGEITGAVVGGLKIWTYTYPAHVTDLTSAVDMSVDPSATTHGMPRALHPVLADMVVIDYKNSREKPMPLTENEQNLEKRTERALAALRGVDKNEQIIGHLPSAASRGNDGQDY